MGQHRVLVYLAYSRRIGLVAFARRLKAGTHEGACSRSTLLQHAPGAKLLRLHQRFLAKKYVAQQNFCSRVLFQLVWYEGASSRGKSVAQACTSLFQDQGPSCALKFACRDMTCLQVANQIGLYFHPQLIANPNQVVSSFSILVVSAFVCTGWGTYPGGCFGSVFQEQAPSCVPALMKIEFKLTRPQPSQGSIEEFHSVMDHWMDHSWGHWDYSGDQANWIITENRYALYSNMHTLGTQRNARTSPHPPHTHTLQADTLWA